MKTPARLVVLLAVSLSLPVSAPAQDSLRVVILSPRLGPVITPAHRERFRIFQQIDRFQSAVICQARNGDYYAWIESLLPSGTVKRELQPYSYSSVRMMAEKVEHFEKIIDGTYVMGSVPVHLEYADSSTVAKMSVKPPATAPVPQVAAGGKAMTVPPPSFERYRREAAKLAQEDVLPFAGMMEKDPFERVPVLRFGVGISSFSWGGTEVQEILDLLQEQLAKEGYTIPRYEFHGIKKNPMLLFSIDLLVHPSWGAILEAGKVEDEGQGASFTSASLSVFYRPAKGISSVVRPYAALGAAYYRLNLKKSFMSGVRVSPIDSNGAYYRLDNISIWGNDGRYGGVATFGLELLFPPDIDLFARYMFGPEFQIDSSWGATRKFFPDALSFGIRAMIRF